MSIQKKSVYTNTFMECKFCGGSGKVEIYRSDWEDFDEIECEFCNGDNC